MMFSRRWLLSLIGTLPFVGTAAKAETWHKWYPADFRNKTIPVTSVYASSFAELEAKLDALPNQQLGSPTAVCKETGEEYETITISAWARPGDEAFIEKAVANQMSTRISTAMNGRIGTIYWRSCFEASIRQSSQVLSYDDSGPDIDFLTDKRCHMDHNWVAVGAYIRFTRAWI